MGKIYNLIKEKLEEFKDYKKDEKTKYIESKTFNKIFKAFRDSSYVNSLIAIINSNKEKYFGSIDNYKAFLAENNGLFLKNDETSIPLIEKNPYSHDYKELINYEQLLNNLEKKIGEANTKLIIDDFEANQKKEYSNINKPLIPYMEELKSQVDLFNFSEEEKKEFKENFEYVGNNLIEKKQPLATEHLIDDVSISRDYAARAKLTEYANSIGIDPNRLENLNRDEDYRLELPSRNKETVEFTKQIGLKKLHVNNDFKNKVLQLDAKITELGIPSVFYVGEQGTKSYGLHDYFVKGREITRLIGTYKNLTTEAEKKEQLRQINLKTKELKEIENKYEDIFNFIKENFNLDKMSLNGNIYCGRKSDFDPNRVESFLPNLPEKWDHENVGMLQVLSGFCQLKGAALEANMPLEEYIDDPVRGYIKQVKIGFEAHDAKFLLPRSAENTLGKRIAHVLVMPSDSHRKEKSNLNIKARGLEFVQKSQEEDEYSIENAIISNIGTNYVELFEHTPERMFMNDNDPSYESLRNLFAMGEQTDKLYQLSDNYYDENIKRGSVINYDSAVRQANQNPIEELHRVMNTMKDYILEKERIYDDPAEFFGENDMINDPVDTVHVFVGAKMYYNDYLTKNNINIMDLPKNDRKLVQQFLNDPAKTFMKQHKRNLGITNQVVNNFKQEFKEAYVNLNRENGNNFINSFDRHNQKDGGFNVGKNITRILSDNKGGFFERIGFRTSKEYLALKAAVEAATDPNSPTYGDYTNVKLCAQKYIDHKLPEGVKFEDVGETGQRRLEFCYSVLDTCREIEAAQENSIIDNNIIDNNISVDNNNFQNQLQKDINLDKNVIDENIIDTNNNIITENEMNK